MNKIIEEITQLRIANARLTAALQKMVEACERGGCRCSGGIFCSMCEAKATANIVLKQTTKRCACCLQNVCGCPPFWTMDET